ncbi:MAG: 2,3-bisphosphoglycerate-independent phosphoglycerate mutase [Deltaproteobacteria bacterium]|nr:MAG: 2,3-bisphosphoglycerate-independent phosphoglycerate mutase [Deltaproteobacteria bacterium]
MTQPLLLVVLDGFGIGDGGAGDATRQAHAPFLERARQRYPSARILTSGRAVGLPEGQMGNSEVGHMTLGAGRIIDQDMTRIDRAIAGGELEGNPAIAAALAAAREGGGTLHLMGLVSDGGVHSHQNHLHALLELCGRQRIATAVHAFLDGRDTAPRSGAEYLRRLAPHVAAAGAHVATVIGRYYAMDRDNRWDRVGRAYDAIVCREGLRAADAEAAVRDAYDRGETDEFVQPAVIDRGAPLRDGDAVIFFNFRADRARELTNAITGVCPERFEGALERAAVVAPRSFVCLTEYDAAFGLPVAFPPLEPVQILPQVLCEHDLRQLRIAETEKYAHVTFFFNNGIETPFAGEDRILIPSPRDVPTYDHKPEMSALQVTEELIARIDRREHAFVLLNFANPDMVGHTGVLPAAVKAVETIDACLDRAVNAILAQGGAALITADHGNCERMIDPTTGGPHTAHTTNPVPIFWVTRDARRRRLRDGGLADLAPTVLELLELPVPPEMKGRSLID